MAAMTQPVNFSGTTQVNATSYATGSRPAASTVPDIVIHDSTRDRHQISDGTNWIDMPVVPPTTPQGVPQYVSGAEPSAVGLDKAVIRIGTSYYQSDNTQWNLLGTNIADALANYVGVRTVKGAAQATFLTRRTPAATLYYDPVSGNNGNAGTSAAAPKKDLPGTFVAGTAYLIKSGTTIASLSVGQDGTVTDPIVIGVYDPVTGQRYTGRAVGLVAVTGGITITSRTYISLEHLSANGGTNRILANNSANCQIICCRANGATQNGILHEVYGAGSGPIELDGCELLNNTQDGFATYGDGSSPTITGTKVQYCTSSGNRMGINVGGDLTRYDQLSIANNTLDNNRGRGSTNNTSNVQIKCFARLTNSSIRWNTLTRGKYTDIWVNGAATVSTFDGLVIENNFSDGAQFGVHLSGRIRGTATSPIIVQYNRLWRNGSIDGGQTPADPAMYGRSIEIFAAGGTAEADMPAYITVRWNDLSYAYNFGGPIQNATEGVGLGFDDNTRFLTGYGNVIVRNEGNGCAVWNDKYHRVFANVFIDNFKLPADRRGNTGPQGYSGAPADLTIGLGPETLAFCNAIVTGRGQWQGFSINADGGGLFISANVKVHNNLMANAPATATVFGPSQVLGGGIRMDPTYTTTQSNHYSRVQFPKLNYNSNTSIALSTGETISAGTAVDDAFAHADSISLTLFQTIPLDVTAFVPPVVPPEGSNTVTLTPATAATTNSASSLSVAYPAGEDDDTQIIVVAYRLKATSITTPAGWTKAQDIEHDSADGRLVLFYRTLTGTTSAGSETISFGAAVMAVGIGATIVGTYSASSAGPTNVGFTTAPTAPSVTAATAFSMWLQILSTTAFPRVFTPPGVVTEKSDDQTQDGSNGIGLALGVIEVPAGATGVSGAWTTVDASGGSGAERPLSLSVAFEPRAGDVTPPLPPPPTTAAGNKPFRYIFNDFEI